ncbi:MAG: hypothetical protein AUK47_18720 [Deltaproteobacteria bacterium CG2_30_63_29]|nr:MAG: hypothetical protein AUK47_18720 [Deltaproteobacteria bacterium CG2_30_63_29]PJB47718.1 MAG: hypothetical protein CO108_03545 [Deltaproteobacteria bacterium CG_4_9_14_3_um_filter_63_12]
MTLCFQYLRVLLSLVVLSQIVTGCDTRAVEAVTDAQSLDAATELVEQPDGTYESALQFSPDPVRFGQLEVGVVESRTVTLTNVGGAPVNVISLQLIGSSDYEPVAGTRANMSLPSNPLAVGEPFEFLLVYAPTNEGSDVAELAATYELAGVEHRQRVWVTNEKEFCVVVSPADELDFRNVDLGESTSMVVTLRNCGMAPLTVKNLALEPGSDPAFELTGVPNLPKVLSQNSSRQVLVRFTPPAAGPFSGALVITTDNPSWPEITLPIVGNGYVNTCPTAVATAQAEPGQEFTDALEVYSMTHLTLSAEGSSDPDGDALVEYRWSILEAPYGYAQRFEPSANEPAPQIWLSLIGDYVFELEVVDENGLESCEPSRVSVHTSTNRDLVIELVWRTPSDLDETDTRMGGGTDLDLHFKRPGGVWDDKFAHTDCHFRSTRQELNAWGAVGAEDNPGLNRDDIDGGGPEQIDVRHPAYTDGSQATGYSEPYEIGVYYYQDWNFEPPVMARINLYLNQAEAIVVPLLPPGQEQAMALSISDPAPAAQGHFWLVGTLDWDADGGHFTQTSSESQPMLGFPN